MAIEKYSPNDIPDLNQDWGQDINDPQLRPYSGRAVQKIIREQLIELRDAKFGHVAYEAGSLIFYDEDNGTVISTVALSGTIYTINLESLTLPTFTVLTSEIAKVITITPTSKEGTIGSELVEFLEDYSWVMSVDSGNGFINVSNGICLSGSSFSADTRPYVKVGTNRIRFTVTGLSSNQTKSTVFTANLTSLSFSCLHPWQVAWIENEPYYLQGIYFSGNMQKVLNIRIDDDPEKTYTQVFSASTSYTSSPFIFNLTDYFPGTTGIHKIDVWITGVGVTTDHILFDVMCVKTVDKFTAKLICLNEVKSLVYNYEDQEIFKFSTYGTGNVTFNLSATDNLGTYQIIENQSVNVITENKNSYALRLEIPTEEQSGLTLSINALVDVDTQTKEITVNNDNAFAPVSGADFYMNTSLRNNSSEDRDVILNNALDPQVLEYPAVWSGFAWGEDGWGVDDQSVKCLAVQAGSSVVANTFKPLAALGGNQSLTLEWKIKVDDVSDYSKPLMSFMSDEEYDVNTTNGIIVFPTNILILNSSSRNTVQQSVNFEEGEQLHFVVVFQANYGTTGRNLCRIYINAIQQCVFEYDGSTNFGNGYMKLGQTSTDLYLYMMRYYNNRALDPQSVLKNWLNALTETEELSRQGINTDNDIIDGTNINYELAKQRGFNTMVVEMAGDIAIPSLSNNVKAKSTVTVEYSDHPEWNFRITNAPIDGQGTTSKRYYRWNLRWKLNSSSVWHYSDNTTHTRYGWFDGEGNHPKVGRITAKKNIASSSQGHKMGACAFYDDLYKQLNLEGDLLPGARVAVYQHPVLGFQKFADGSYLYTGLYTVGPDKGDLGTFGYDYNIFPDLLSIEGPNHAPLGTRFLHPWIDVTFDSDEETLSFGGQEGWDIAAYNSSKYPDTAALLSLYEAEWKPAYDLAYFCSIFLKSIAETGMTLEQINADVLTFRNSSSLLGYRRNEVLTLYDDNYNLIFYRNLTGQYEILAGHDVRTYVDGYLVNMVDPTTEDLIAARKAKFEAEAENFFDVEAMLYHENYLMLVGGSDNHAKNFYPFKLKSLAEGGRWQFRQDDLDTILATDNNGNPTKAYHVEPGDLTASGTDIYQGSSSSLWTLCRAVFQSRLRAMMADMISGLSSLAASRSLTKGTIHRTIFAMFDYYFWRNSAKYFPALAYAEDTTYNYVDVWALDPGATYNSVYPLTQALGTQLEAEKHWALRRIIYVFSKYSIAGFSGSYDDGLNSLEFTPGQAYTFNLTPAINMYPAGNLGGGNNIVGARTDAGEVCQIAATSDGTTTFYLKGLDWLTSLGDLSNLVLTSRGGVSTINFSINSKRLNTLKVGDVDAQNVAFNATALDVRGEGLEEIDAQNVTTILSPVNLANCPRLKVAKFAGSSVPTVLLPSGSKINTISLPASLQNLYLNGLPMLDDDGLQLPIEALGNIRGIYIANCPNISYFNLLMDILNTSGHELRFITIFLGVAQGDANTLPTIAKLATPYNPDTDTGYGRVNYDTVNKLYTYNGQKPNIQGVLNVTVASIVDLEIVNSVFTDIQVNYSVLALTFADELVSTLMLMYDVNSDGYINILEIQGITSFNGLFLGQAIVKFNELFEFSGITALAAGQFNGCTALEEIALPKNLITLSNGAFFDCVSLEKIVLPDGIISIGTVGAGNGVFENCASLVNINLGNIVTVGSKAFKNALAYNVAIPANVQTIGDEAYYGCIGLEGSLVLPTSLTSLGASAFQGAGYNGSLTVNAGLTELKANAFAGCQFTGALNLPASLTTVDATSINGLIQLTALNLAVGYDLDVYHDFEFANFSAASVLQSILNCQDGTAESPKELKVSFAVYQALLALDPDVFLDAELRYINISNVGFVPFVAPESFVNPAQFANFGEDMNIYEAFNAYPNANKKCIYTVRQETASTVLPAIAGMTYAYKQDDGIMTDYAILASGTITWTPGSSKRHIIYINVNASVSTNRFPSASWIYLGSGLTMTGQAAGNDTRYIHIYGSTTNVIMNLYGSYDNTGKWTGSLFIPEGVTTTGQTTYGGSSLNEKIVFPATLTSFSLNGAYPNVNSILSRGSTYIVHDNVLYDTRTKTAVLNAGLYTGTLEFLPDTATIYGLYRNRTGTLSIPTTVTSIGNRVFSGCSGFTGSLTIPNSVTSIGTGAFRNCFGFTGALTIPNSVTSIGSGTFNGCKFNAITSTSSKYPSYDNVLYEEVVGGFDAILNATEYVGSLTFMEGTKAIVGLGFTKRTGTLTIPDSVTSINQDAFYGCSGFNGTLTIPDSVTSIGSNAFRDCIGFTDATINKVIPPTLSTLVFSGTFPIYVPAESVDTYKAATNWSAYAARIFAIV